MIPRVRPALTLLAAVGLLLAVPVASQADERAPRTKTLVFEISLTPVSQDSHSLPGGVIYGQGTLEGTTSWGRRAATVEWQCSRALVDGAGPANDLVTIRRSSDGAVLALAVTGWITPRDGAPYRLDGSVEVLGGKGRYRGATGNGTVTGLPGRATLTVTVVQPHAAPRDAAAPRAWGDVGC